MGRVPGAGPGVHEQRRLARLDTRQQRREQRERIGPGERRGRQRDADAATREQAIDVVGIERVERDGAPRGEAVGQCERALRCASISSHALRARQRFDADRARERDQREIEAVVLDAGSRAARAASASTSTRYGCSPAECRIVRPLERRTNGSVRRVAEAVQQRLGPEMLVDVDLHLGNSALRGLEGSAELPRRMPDLYLINWIENISI